MVRIAAFDSNYEDIAKKYVLDRASVSAEYPEGKERVLIVDGNGSALVSD